MPEFRALNAFAGLRSTHQSQHHLCHGVAWANSPYDGVGRRNFRACCNPWQLGVWQIAGFADNKKPRDGAAFVLHVVQEIGGAEEDRTPDLRIANATLSQLSYRPIFGRTHPAFRAEAVAFVASRA